MIEEALSEVAGACKFELIAGLRLRYVENKLYSNNVELEIEEVDLDILCLQTVQKVFCFNHLPGVVCLGRGG